MQGDVWFVYDGECPLCRVAAQALRIRQSVGHLHLVDARVERDHPLMARINQAGLDLDEGMVLAYGDRLYHGAEALTLMGLIGSEHGWFNRMNALLFRSPALARFTYPAMRGVRNLLIRMLGAGKIDNLGGR
ncbi:DCC1-like thiol-disulfide oxidoreductase family protein [Rhizobium sp. G21]|uniref:DCC1-like thiol-disulfide oxidoreductase family protein n=1 Tax=Rhizobium sp. G21 TaxID=2758439 RepID=UPI001603F488|nr:DCC1-like thiol-disulfide oxidoreductase family protein [Rhizobium sp. G21]MBB1248542.1 DUF393 domain-containing protein [Rhizobium sp. G21]